MQIKIEKFFSKKVINENILQLRFFNRIIQYFSLIKRVQNQSVPHLNLKDLNDKRDII